MSADTSPGADERGARADDSHRRGPIGPPRSLCPECAHVKIVRSEKGSTFLLCRRAQSDPRFPKYPPQPVVACAGFER